MDDHTKPPSSLEIQAHLFVLSKETEWRIRFARHRILATCKQLGVPPGFAKDIVRDVLRTETGCKPDGEACLDAFVDYVCAPESK